VQIIKQNEQQSKCQVNTGLFRTVLTIKGTSEAFNRVELEHLIDALIKAQVIHKDQERQSQTIEGVQ
jgi:hypothetical protein